MPIKTVLILSLMLLSGKYLQAGIREEAEQLIRESLPTLDSLEFSQQPLTAALKKQAEQAAGQAFILEDLYLWELQSGGKSLGWAVLDNVQGKVQPITYLVIFSPGLEIIRVSVLRYREQIGGAVQNPVWLSQFQGRNADSEYRLGRDIDGISGATLSANALARGLQRLVLYLDLNQAVLSTAGAKP